MKQVCYVMDAGREICQRFILPPHLNDQTIVKSLRCCVGLNQKGHFNLGAKVTRRRHQHTRCWPHLLWLQLRLWLRLELPLSRQSSTRKASSRPTKSCQSPSLALIGESLILLQHTHTHTHGKKLRMSLDTRHHTTRRDCSEQCCGC